MPKTSIIDRFMKFVSPEPMSGCWLWTGNVDRGGYARFNIPAEPRWKLASAHRTSYEIFKGPIPEGLDIDHLCRVRCCVNPAHLEAVTTQENVIRGVRAGAGVAISSARAAEKKLANDKCPAGHAYDRYYEKGAKRFRYCFTCWKQKRKERLEKLISH